MSAAAVIGEPSAVAPAEYSPNTHPSRRRPREVRATTIPITRLPKRELQVLRDEAGDVDALPRRPATRADCKDGPRPCPFVSCQHHLYLDVTPAGAIKLNFPDLEPDQLAESCALDVAARGGATLEEVGAVMNVVRERVRQIEARAVRRLGVKGGKALAAYRGHAHDFDHAEIIAPQLPIVSRAVADARRAPPIVSPAPPVVSTEEVIMGGKWSPEQRAKFAATAAAKRSEREAGSVPATRRKPKASAEPAATTMDVGDLSVADLLESHKLVQIIGLDLLRAIADRLQTGGSEL